MSETILKETKHDNIDKVKLKENLRGAIKIISNDEIFNKAYMQDNKVCREFIERRKDFKHDFPYRLYYVNFMNFEYILADDEIEKE